MLERIGTPIARKMLVALTPAVAACGSAEPIEAEEAKAGDLQQTLGERPATTMSPEGAIYRWNDVMLDANALDTARTAQSELRPRADQARQRR